MNVKAVILMIAPTKPPCYSSRDSWVTYLEGVQGDPKRATHPLKGSPPTFNHAFNFCVDCTQQHSLRMEQAGKCDPDHLRKLALSAP